MLIIFFKAKDEIFIKTSNDGIDNFDSIKSLEKVLKEIDLKNKASKGVISLVMTSLYYQQFEMVAVKVNPDIEWIEKNLVSNPFKAVRVESSVGGVDGICTQNNELVKKLYNSGTRLTELALL